MEEADVDRILEEKGKGKRKKYLCSWMDNAPPQWVKAADLEGTVALDEWITATENLEEEFEDEEVVKTKSKTLAGWVKSARRPCILVGAGLSAPVLPTFRGKGGLWTRNPVAFDPSKGPPPPPTTAHKALVALAKAGFVYHLGSQNYDDILGRAGFPLEKMSELHGNVYMEVCENCSHQYHRDFYVAKDDAISHETGRTCEQEGCNGALRDNIVHFEENLPWGVLSKCNAKFVGADLTIALGTSLRVEPAASMPFKSKRRSRILKPKVTIVNLQPTPNDDEADLIIRGTCDSVLAVVANELCGEGWEDAFDNIEKKDNKAEEHNDSPSSSSKARKKRNNQQKNKAKTGENTTKQQKKRGSGKRSQSSRTTTTDSTAAKKRGKPRK
eukprot:m.41365 g.41365  ORF g.41365 m.41365 type:complete len:385 (+) comp10418_c0_seq1:191-1345(+)